MAITVELTPIPSGRFFTPWKQVDGSGRPVFLTLQQIEAGLDLREEYGLPDEASPEELRRVIAIRKAAQGATNNAD